MFDVFINPSPYFSPAYFYHLSPHEVHSLQEPPNSASPLLPSVTTCAIETFRASFLSPDQDLLTNFSFPLGMEKKLSSKAFWVSVRLSAESPVPCPHAHWPSCPIPVPGALSPQQGQTSCCLSHLEAPPHVPSFAVSLPFTCPCPDILSLESSPRPDSSGGEPPSMEPSAHPPACSIFSRHCVPSCYSCGPLVFILRLRLGSCSP